MNDQRIQPHSDGTGRGGWWYVSKKCESNGVYFRQLLSDKVNGARDAGAQAQQIFMDFFDIFFMGLFLLFFWLLLVVCDG